MKSAHNHPEKSPASGSPVGQTSPLLEQKFLALNQLAGGIAHEFNNIIAGILGSAELAAMDIHEGHPSHESLKQIFEASNRARDFLQKIRAFSQRPPAVFQTLTLAPLIEETLQILAGIIPDKVELHAQLDQHCHPVHGDPAQLQQMLLDLCLHCWQNLHERRGQINLTLENARAPKKFHQLAGDCVRLTVQDDGHGLDAHALKKIFDPFHTRRNTAKKIGLELFTAREVIHQHHGEITAESEPGRGLAFHIYLPADDHTAPTTGHLK
jgi:signal transduction histidine kinase